MEIIINIFKLLMCFVPGILWHYISHNKERINRVFSKILETIRHKENNK